MSDIKYTVKNEFTVTLDNLVDQQDNPCEFPITIEVESEGNGDQIAAALEHRIRLAAYDAVDEFDNELE